MGSLGDPQPVGEFMHPLISSDSQNDDPWQRNYGQPPRLNLVPRIAPLTDVRPWITNVEYIPADLLKSHGFGIVKHRSALLEPPYAAHDGFPEEMIGEVYHPEIRDLVMETTGAKHVFITATIVRQGKGAPEMYKLPTGLKMTAAKPACSEAKEKLNPAGEPDDQKKPKDRVLLGRAAPVRVPHLDNTPLGARQFIRSQQLDIYDTAVRNGVIEAEDDICLGHACLAQSKEAESLINEHYNQAGVLGPRYATFSVWRPLRKVGRDPLALAPRRKTATGAKGPNDLVYWPYLNKMAGSKDLGGDYLREFAMLGVRLKQRPDAETDGPEWYYLPGQEPDEVLIIKLFDSAALGTDAEHAAAPWHASPEFGVNAAFEDDTPRESIEIRAIAFW